MSQQHQQTVSQNVLDKLAALEDRLAALEPEPTRRQRIEDWLMRAVFLFIVVVGIGVAAVVIIATIYDTWRPDYPDYTTVFPADQELSPNEELVLRRADEVLGRAIETGEDVDRLVSFLESIGVLLALASAAAAVIGIRNAQEIRRELQAEFARLVDLRDLIDERLDELEASQAAVQTQIRDETAANQRRIEHEVDDLRQTTIDLLEAHQHLRSGHHRQAYEAARRALIRDPENPEALYISGWLKLQHLQGFDLDDGIAELRQAVALAPHRPAISAALGVLLRRKARRAPEKSPERRDLFNEAEGLLRTALASNNELLDLSSESLYGPIAGLHRDQGDIDGAIRAYEEAVRITPGSAYPRGNLAGLYLERYTRTGNRDALDKATKHFRRTLELAETRLVIAPQDYWLLMDIAMSQTILAQFPPSHSTLAEQLGRARARLQEALDLHPTSEMLRTSLVGWNILRAACPEEWGAIRQALDAAFARIEQIATAQEADHNEPPPMKESTTDGS